MSGDYRLSASYLKDRVGDFVPDVALILGSGLGFMGELVENPVIVDYGDIPGFKRSTAPGHAGRLVFGRLRGKNVAVMQGRLHYYEGNSMADVVLPLRALRLMGAKTLIVTNASGGVNLDCRAGELMLINDHIKLFSDGPLRGENDPELGERFPDCTYLYTPRLREVARAVAAEQQLPLREGVYMFFPGPQYETPAEVRMARLMGADAVGMSTVPEVLAAAHSGMEVLGVSLIANAGAGVTGKPLSEQEVLDAAAAARERFSALIAGCLERM